MILQNNLLFRLLFLNLVGLYTSLLTRYSPTRSVHLRLLERGNGDKIPDENNYTLCIHAGSVENFAEENISIDCNKILIEIIILKCATGIKGIYYNFKSCYPKGIDLHQLFSGSLLTWSFSVVRKVFIFSADIHSCRIL